ncbi:MAG: hypothetical protein KAK04_02310, partial [Cyclobacteriaceae bacterium]|nr:hypothetical protein [Cyclobacteriaceae bacterium]
MPSQKNILRFITFLGIFTWLAILGSGYIFRFGQLHNASSDPYLFFSKALLIVFIVIIYFFYRNNIG